MSLPKSTPVTIPATQAQRKFGELVRRVFSGKEHFVVEKDGLPVMAIISMKEYDEFLQERERHEQDKQERLKKFRRAARAIGEEFERQGLTEEDVDAMVEATRQRLYEEKHGKKPAK
jgi:prevent-host-death family protein